MNSTTTTPTNPSQTSAYIPPIRHVDFHFKSEEFDDQFFLKTDFVTAYFESLSIFLTLGEDLVIETARHHRNLLKNAVLRQRVTSLIGQEAIHSKIHNLFNDTVLAKHRFPVPFFRSAASIVFKHTFLKFPQPLKLSMMAAIEHFTAVIAAVIMEHEHEFFKARETNQNSIFFSSQDLRQGGLWMWHMLEEAEHKDIAYDVYQTLSGNYPLRILGFAIAFTTVVILISLAALTVPVIRNPVSFFKKSFWQDLHHSSRLLYGKEGLYGENWGLIFSYLKKDFHPNQHPTDHFIQFYQDQLFNPNHGLLKGFFVKEFTPKLETS